jgi:hypothetical protein
MSNALTVVSAILFRPYRFSSSNETGFNIKFIKNKLQGVSMQVRVNPNHVFKRMNRAWLSAKFAWLIWLPVARLNGLRYLMPKKKGESDSPPKFTSHERPFIFFENYDKTRRTLLFDKHFSDGVTYPCVHGLSPLYTDQ